MSENTKKNVIIDLEESEKIQLDGVSKLEKIDVSGKLSVINVSERNRIWNVKVHLGDTRDSTDITDESLSGGEIDVSGTWESGYSVETKAPIVTLTEVFDTCGDVETEEPHWAYVSSKDNPVKITITIKNESDGEIDSIIIQEER